MTGAARTTAASLRIGAAASIGISAAATIAFALAARESSHFVRDDLVAFRDAASTPLLELLWRPIDLHFLPLHRLAGFLMFRTAPWNFDVALGVLFAFQMLGVWMLHRTLERIGPSPLNAPLLLLYGTNFYLGVMFTWWAAGIARLPCLLLTIAAIYGYLKFRDTGKVRHIAGVAACLVAASSFFSKGLLIPGYLAAIEIVYAWDTPRRRIARNLAAVAGVTLVAIAMRAVGELVIAPYRLTPIEWSEQAKALLAVAEMVQQGIFGITPSQPRSAASWLSLAVWLGVIAATTLQSWRNGLTWLVAGVAIAVNFLMISLSPRLELFGALVVTNERYLFEVWFIVILFAAIVLQRSSGGRPVAARTVIAAWAVALACAAASQHSFRALMATPRYAEGAITRTYIENLEAGISKLRAEHDGVLAFRRGRVPPRVVGFSADSVRPLSVFLPLFDRAVRVTNRGYCLYKVNADGTIAAPAGECRR